MRYYEIIITTVDGKELRPSSLGGQRISSLLPNGLTNPAALNIELDLPVGPFAAPIGNAFVRIWGLGLKDIGNSFDLNGANVKVYGGMAPGLPLASAAYGEGQAGLLVQGSILQAYGNWVGTVQTVDLVIYASTGTPDTPKGYVLNWPKGTTLASALKQMLDVALPGMKQNIVISSNLVQAYDETHHTGTLEAMSAFIKDRSKGIITDQNYRGVEIFRNGDIIVASDLSTPPASKTIQVRDLIGQPTWIRPNVIQVKTIMRADLSIDDVISIPNSLIQTQQAALISFTDPKANLTFAGDFLINELHHFGDFRQPDAASWNTTFNAAKQPK